jgi:flagellar hook assembly protein FlgD
VACVAGLLIDQRIRREGLVVDRIRVKPTLITPNGDGRHDTAAISFRIKGPDRVTLELLDSFGHVVRHLAVAQRLGDRKVAHFTWNGLTDSGAPAPAGGYRLRILEIKRDRTITPPNEDILLVRTP